MYTVSVAGTTSLDGIMQWNVGDHAVYNGTVWQKIGGIANEVTSVAGRTGDIVLSAADIGGLANLATSGSFNDLLDVPTASGTVPGLVQVGANLTITNGVLAATASPYTLPTATTSTLGGVIVGPCLSVSGPGVITVAGGSVVNAVENEGTGTGLVDNNGVTGSIATIRSLAAGPGVSIVPSGDGTTLTINANGAVTSVNGNTSDVEIDADNLPNLATVGMTGSYTDLLNIPTTFNPPVATSSVLGAASRSRPISRSQEMARCCRPRQQRCRFPRLNWDIPSRRTAGAASISAAGIGSISVSA
ncbi:hypothetical protein [Paraburkholderia heleia]|uniref:hypothetical protein n=1 Tax=Paraburkholderia heleia TaxID=634127 RepID=UPI002AB7EAE9|nr:hypothetical protein [Paraburkholderia heleia]